MYAQKFEELIIWQLSRNLVKNIYTLLRNNKDYAFRDQLQRASVSIMSNIAEGFERKSTKEMLYQFNVAKGSAGEVRSLLYVAFDIGYINEEDFNRLSDNVKEISSKVHLFIKSKTK